MAPANNTESVLARLRRLVRDPEQQVRLMRPNWRTRCPGVGHQVKLRPLWCTWAQTADVDWKKHTLFFVLKKGNNWSSDVPKGRKIPLWWEWGSDGKSQRAHSVCVYVVFWRQELCRCCQWSPWLWSPAGRHIWNWAEHADLRREIKVLLSFRWWCHLLGWQLWVGWQVGWLVCKVY